MATCLGRGEVLLDPMPSEQEPRLVTLPGSSAYRYLAFAGALPFIACAVLMALGFADAPVLGGYDNIAAAYVLTILSFMSGIHWGTYLYRHSEISLNLFVTSNIVTIAGWIVFLILPVQMMFFFSMIGFATLLLIDHGLYKHGLITRPYYETRRNVTFIVIACLAVLGFA